MDRPHLERKYNYNAMNSFFELCKWILPKNMTKTILDSLRSTEPQLHTPPCGKYDLDPMYSISCGETDKLTGLPK